MSSFGNSFSSLPGSSSSSAVNPEEVKQQLKKEMAVANAQELISNINKNCFKMCISNPGSNLSGKDETCLSQCIDKYLNSWDVVSKAYIDRIQQERH